MHEAIRTEQQTLDAAWQRRADLLADLDATLDGARGDDDTSRARLGRLRGRRAELQHAEAGIVFGRIDGDDGTVRHLGRVGLPGDDGDDPLVLDWRAPAALLHRHSAGPAGSPAPAAHPHPRSAGRRGR